LTAAELVARGNRALASRQLSRAKALYRQALDLEPGHRQARTGLGRVAFQQGQFEEAVRQLEPLYRNQGHMDLGVAYVRVGRRDDARRQFEKLLDRNPGNADARRALDALNR
jgi:Flp pilus assembly protein TadD